MCGCGGSEEDVLLESQDEREHDEDLRRVTGQQEERSAY